MWCWMCLQVYYCKEDEVCLYESLLFEVPFVKDDGGALDSSPEEIAVGYGIKPKTSTGGLGSYQLPAQREE